MLSGSRSHAFSKVSVGSDSDAGGVHRGPKQVIELRNKCEPCHTNGLEPNSCRDDIDDGDTNDNDGAATGINMT